MLNNMNIRSKINSIVVVFIVGLIIFGTVSFICLNTVKIRGELYNNIIQGKDLIADILPPPEYIIESYLLVLQMVDEKDKAKLNDYIERSKKLRLEYVSRHNFWIDDLDDGDIKNIMVNESYKPAIEFFDIRDSKFIAAILKGDRKTAVELAHGILKTKYEEHRQKIDKVVELSVARNAADEKKADDTLFFVFTFLIAFGLSIIVVIILFWIVLSKSLKPLSEITGIVKDISEGDGDLTKRISINSKDEIGYMAKYFNNFVESVEIVVVSIYENTIILGKASNELLHVSDQMAINIEQSKSKSVMAGKTVGRILGKINNVAEAMADASRNMNIIAAAIEEMSGTIKGLAQASEKISKGVNEVDGLASQISTSMVVSSESSKEVSASVESVTIAIKEINISLNEINKNCDRSIDITSDASKKASFTNKLINDLESSSKQIEKIINVINDIADQTNMLALNAAIEAAGAGEAGKGFAVVANEVKELAKQTSEATDEISQQIETMQSNMSGVVKAVEDITEVIAEITIITNTIAAAVTQQSSTTGDILNAVVKASGKVNKITKEFEDVAANSKSMAISVSEASKGVNQIARSAQELSLASNEAAKNIDHLSTKVEDVAKAANEISEGSLEIDENIKEIDNSNTSSSQEVKNLSEAAKALSILANKLEGYVKRFKVS
jgi:methyl-accepting chemotaxis protein